MKRFWSFLLLLLLVFSLGAKTLHLATEHFDIIYGEESLRVAKVLYDHLEDEYRDLVSYFHTDPKLHLPVYVTTEYEDFNAYFTSYPYSHIVLYNTVPDLEIGLSNAEDTILLTAKHELTHAFTCNLRGPFLEAVSKIIGEPVTLTGLNEYQSFVEGIAVTVESKDGMGRLHSPLKSATLKQAKLENRKLSYMDVSGSRDISPVGDLPYFFGGNFLDYVGRRYGEEKLGDLFNYLGRFHFALLPTNFRKVIGIPMDHAWDLFWDSIPVPRKVLSPETISDYGGYSNLTLQDGVVYALDSQRYLVLSLDEANRQQKLFHSASASRHLSVSPEGLFLLPKITEEEAEVRVVKDSLLPYGTTQHVFSGYRNGAFGTLEGETVILLYRVEDQMASLDLYSSTYEKLSTLSLGYGVTGDEYSAMGDGKMAFILSSRGNQYLALLSLCDMSLRLVEDVYGLQYSSFSATEEGLLTFGYVKKDDPSALSRYGEGRLTEDGMELRLSTVDYNGGVYYPVRKEDEVYFVSKFFLGAKLSKTTLEKLDLGEPQLVSTLSYEAVPEPEGLLAFKEASSSYHPLSYFKKGLLLPLATTNEVFSTTDSGFGLSYVTQDPAAFINLSANVGWGWEQDALFASLRTIFHKDFALSVVAQGFGKTPLYEVTGEYLWNKSLHTASESIGAKYTLGLLSEGESVQGKQRVLLEYRNVWKYGPGRYNRAGFQLQASLTDSLDGKWEKLSPSFGAVLFVPQLLPFSSTPLDTYNLPLKLYATTTLDTLSYGGYAFLWTHEVQRSMPFLSLYLRNVDFYGTATGHYSYQDQTVAQDQYGLCLDLTFTPVIGEIGNTISATLGLGLYFQPGDSPKVKLIWKVN